MILRRHHLWLELQESTLSTAVCCRNTDVLSSWFYWMCKDVTIATVVQTYAVNTLLIQIHVQCRWTPRPVKSAILHGGDSVVENSFQLILTPMPTVSTSLCDMRSILIKAADVSARLHLINRNLIGPVHPVYNRYLAYSVNDRPRGYTAIGWSSAKWRSIIKHWVYRLNAGAACIHAFRLNKLLCKWNECH